MTATDRTATGEREDGASLVGEGLPEGFPTVVAFEGSTRADLYERWLPDRVPFVRPDSVAAAREVIDESTAVALVRHELSESNRRAIRSLLDRRAPECRVVLTTSTRSPVADDMFDIQMCLNEPIDEDGFRNAVSRQLHLAMHAALTERYYQTTAAMASLEVRLDETEREENDRYRDLDEHVKKLKAQLDAVERYLDPGDVSALLFEIVPPEFERQSDELPAGENKYRPDRCHQCDRDWNANPDGSRAGYKRLGSLVWKCDDCGTVYNRSNPTNNRIDPPR